MTILETRIASLLATANCGDEIVLSRLGSVEQGTGLILGYGHEGWYLQDSGHRADLGVTVTLGQILADAAAWARDTGSELAWPDCHHRIPINDSAHPHR